MAVRRRASRTPTADLAWGTEVGKRYGNDDESIVVLCTNPGVGGLSIDGRRLHILGAKPCPPRTDRTGRQMHVGMILEMASQNLTDGAAARRGDI